jgi:hypothetical protein
MMVTTASPDPESDVGAALAIQHQPGSSYLGGRPGVATTVAK